MNDDLRLCSVAMCLKQHMLLQTKHLQVQCRDIVGHASYQEKPSSISAFLIGGASLDEGRLCMAAE